MEEKSVYEWNEIKASGKRRLIIGIILVAVSIVFAAVMGAIWGLQIADLAIKNASSTSAMRALGASSAIVVILGIVCTALEAVGIPLIITGIVRMVRAKKAIARLNTTSTQFNTTSTQF